MIMIDTLPLKSHFLVLNLVYLLFYGPPQFPGSQFCPFKFTRPGFCPTGQLFPGYSLYLYTE
jgi:hypothetical protein